MDLSTFRQTGLSYKRKASAAFIQITPNQDMTFILGLIQPYCVCWWAIFSTVYVYSRHPFKVLSRLYEQQQYHDVDWWTLVSNLSSLNVYPYFFISWKGIDCIMDRSCMQLTTAEEKTIAITGTGGTFNSSRMVRRFYLRMYISG